jgi:O-antigen/teichoic acid export membrane protein
MKRVSPFIEEILQQKNLLWSASSFCLMAVSGLSLNVVIAHYYGSEALGEFNLLLSIYIVLSQFSNFGLYYSQLHFSASPVLTNNQKLGLLKGGMFLTAGFTISIILLAILVDRAIGLWFQSPTIKGFYWMLLTLVPFALNKLVLAHYNAIGSIVHFSIFQMIRYLIISIGVWILAFKEFDSKYLMLVFFTAESLLCCILMLMVGPLIFVQAIGWNAFQTHYHFSKKVFLSGFFQDVTSKLDILILGVFVLASDIGRYSIPAFLAEGLVQICMAFLIIITPELTRLTSELETQQLRMMLQSNIRLVRKILVIVVVLVVIAIPILIQMFALPFDVFETVGIFLLIGLSVIYFSPYYILQIAFNQFGYPKQYTKLLAFYALGNAALNFILILFLGIWGSAIATALNNLLFKYYFQYMVEKTFTPSQRAIVTF